MSAHTPLLFGASAVVIAVGEVTDVQSVGFTDAAQLRSAMTAPALIPFTAACFIVGALLAVLAIASFWADVQGRGGRWTRVGLGMLAAGALWYATFRGAGDILTAVLLPMPEAVRTAVFNVPGGWVQRLDPVLMAGWLLGPIPLWIGLRLARCAHWLLLVGYLVAVAVAVAVAVEIAFAFVSLPVEGVSALLAIGTVAVMTRTAAPVRPEAALV